MQLSEESFIWSNAAFAVGFTMAIDVSAFFTSVMLFTRTRSFFYFSLAFISIAHICDMLFLDIGSMEYQPSNLNAKSNAATYLFFGCLFAWIDGSGFAVLNILRFLLIGRSILPKAAIALGVLAGLSILLCTINNILYLYHYGIIMVGNAEIDGLQDICDTFFAAWSVYDSLANTAISMSFIYILRSIGVSSNLTLQKGFDMLLRRIIGILILECGALLIANSIITFVRDIDPLWVSVYAAEAFRLRMFCMFLSTLSEMLKKRTMAISTPIRASYQASMEAMSRSVYAERVAIQNK